ncbi:MAG: FG-GAP-like repeat-containing protein [Cyanobacteria bacterium]|nr:FG-GAP-like repeat-containing protein [Cyanobacteriota bacterium]
MRRAILCAFGCVAGLTVLIAQDGPTEAIRLNNLGVAYLTQGRANEAVDAFRQALQRNRSLDIARLNEGIALMQAQRLTEARDALAGLTKQQPQNTRAWYNLGLAHRTLGESDAAIAAFERVGQLDPNDADAHYFLAQLHLQAGRYEQAIAIFRKSLTLDSRHASAEFGLARAYQLSGDADAAARHLARFDELAQTKLGKPIGSAYGDQGTYSTAEAIAAADQAPAEFAIRLSADTRAGIRFNPSAPAPSHRMLPMFGSGACFTDFDADGRPDLLLLGGAQRAALYRNAGGNFTDVTSRAGLNVTQHATGCTAADFDNDGRDDIAIGLADGIAMYRNDGNGRFRDATSTLGIRVTGPALGVAFVDYDHDGDLDLYVPRFVEDAPANQMWRNNGNGTFTETTSQAGVAGDAAGIGVVATDIDNDRAIDLVLTGQRPAALVLRNPREGAFEPSEPWSPAFPVPPVGAAAFDFNKDGLMDLAFTHWSAPGLSLWKNAGAGRFERAALPGLPWHRGWGLSAIDIDNDGWLDLAAVGETTDDKGELRVLRNLGSARFVDVTTAAGATAPLSRPRALIAGDTDGDGDTDLLITQSGASPLLLRNDGGNRRASVRLSFRGLADNRSGIGAKVEVFAGALRQKWELHSSSGFLGQNAPGILAGIDSARQADIVRLLWPTGVVQDEIQLARSRRHVLNEIDRRGSSCPVLFAWNGEHYEFISDMIGPGIVGHWVAPGQRNIPDPTEYLKIDGSRVTPRNGRLSFRFAEVMEELTYLDHVRLIAVDHPSDITVQPNEYFASRPPFPEFKVIESRNARLPVAARDDEGRDVLPALTHRDRRYVDGFKPIQFGGFAQPHYLELDLGAAYDGGPLRLLMQGFIEYFTATSVFAAHQAGIEAIVPFVDVQRSSGEWVRAIDDIGFPAGLARTSVADLSGKLPEGTSRIRIGTNLKIYWDQILIDTHTQANSSERREVPLIEASMRFLGFPRQVGGNPASDLSYDYGQISSSGPFTRHSGYYTAYGDVRTIVNVADDRFAILGSGDEVALEFDASALPPVKPGWTRDYFFYADGFAKDMDFYEALSDSVEPLPFHAMGQYPYGPQMRYPTGPLHQDYRLNTNTRWISREEVRSFRFTHRR